MSGTDLSFLIKSIPRVDLKTVWYFIVFNCKSFHST